MSQQKILSLISDRYSPMAFSEKVPSNKDMESIFSAAIHAPSAFNEQPWRFVYASKEDIGSYNDFFNCLVDANKIWAVNAPVLALSIAKKTLSLNGKANPYAMYDAGMAVGNILVQAMSLGIFIHQMGGYDKEMARTNLGIPDDFEPIAMMALGYQGDPSKLPAELQQRATKRSSRKNIEEVVYYGRFGN